MLKIHQTRVLSDRVLYRGEHHHCCCKEERWEFQFCIDYKGLNKVTIKDKYHFRALMNYWIIYRKFIVLEGWHGIRTPSDYYIWRVSTECEFLYTLWILWDAVIPFGSTKALLHSWRYEWRFHEHLDRCTIVFIDDILIYFGEERRFVSISRIALDKPGEHQLFAKLRKCSFWQRNVVFLADMVLEAEFWWIQRRLIPFREGRNLRALQRSAVLFGLIVYYWKFIKGFTGIVMLKTRSTCKDVKCGWIDFCSRSFTELKHN